MQDLASASWSAAVSCRFHLWLCPGKHATGNFKLAHLTSEHKTNSFFESDGHVVHLHHSQASGNPVRIGDGCATVTGYKLPLATASLKDERRREGGSEVNARSQDIGLVVLVVAPETELTSPSREG
jgi:hypothetical protein